MRRPPATLDQARATRPHKGPTKRNAMIDWSQTAAVGCEEVGDHRNLRDLESLPRGSRVLLEHFS